MPLLIYGIATKTTALSPPTGAVVFALLLRSFLRAMQRVNRNYHGKQLVKSQTKNKNKNFLKKCLTRVLVCDILSLVPIIA